MSDLKSGVTRFPPEIEADFDLLARRAGLEIPVERRPGVIVAYADLMRTARLLHETRGPDRWTANAYRVDTITAAKDEPR